MNNEIKIDCKSTVIGFNGKIYTIEELQKLCPSDMNEAKIKYEQEKIEHENRYNSEAENLNGEIWVRLSQTGWTNYFVSNFARVKIFYPKENKFYILKQMNEQINGEEHQGYLIFNPQQDYKGRFANNYHVWNLVAMAFLGRPAHYDKGKIMHVHHINNNGYDCRPENLILLTPEQHQAVHGFSFDKQKDSTEK